MLQSGKKTPISISSGTEMVYLLCLVTQLCPTLSNPTDCSCPGSSIYLQARILKWVAMLSSRGSSQFRIPPQSPALQVDSLLSEPPGKPKNTGVIMYVFVHTLFQILFHCRLLQAIKYSSLCYAVGPCLSILYVAICAC